MQFKNPFLNKYLEYVEDTESPRIYHIWSALTAISATLGRRVHLDFGFKPLHANMFTFLVGPAASRKSSAMAIAKSIVQNGTGVTFAPDDTGGQRQGLIAAMLLNAKEDDELLASLENADMLSLEKLGDIQLKTSIDPRDVHVMFACADEMASLVGSNQSELLTFFQRAYDGADYTYQLSKSSATLHDITMSILACTTSTSIANSLPKEAIGQGFMSRTILVYAHKTYKDLPDPQLLDPKLTLEMEKHFNYLFYNFSGVMKETPEAKAYRISQYKYPVEIDDARFSNYANRRYTHLIKLSMNFAAARHSMLIELDDVIEAHMLLKVTETFMPDALGEYGMSPLGVARQKLLDFLMHVKEPVSLAILWRFMQKDMLLRDLRNSVDELVAGNKLEIIKTRKGDFVVYIDKKIEEENLMSEHLSEEGDRAGLDLPENVIPLRSEA